MGGFFNLIEAFLAFALTMLALSTAVSSIIASLIGLFRLRARVLRSLVENFYRNELHPLIERVRARADWRPADPGLTALWDDPATYRKVFVAEMTLLPKVLTTKERDSTTAAIGEAESLAAMGRMERWRALRHSLESLPRETFESRLDITKVGALIDDFFRAEDGDQEDVIKKRAALVGAADAKAAVSQLADRFEALAATASELFARDLKPWTILVGFLIAFSLNVDSFNLLNSYMRNPEVTAAVIDNVESLESSSETAKQIDDADDEKAKLDRQIAELKGLVADLPAGEAKDAAAETLETALQVAEDSGQMALQVERAILPLTEAFPIGWNRYPNCVTGTTDTRCIGPRHWGTTLTWFLGVMMTGFLVGLGTPFWVRLVNQVLRARSVTQRARDMAQRMSDRKQAEASAAARNGQPGSGATG